MKNLQKVEDVHNNPAIMRYLLLKPAAGIDEHSTHIVVDTTKIPNHEEPGLYIKENNIEKVELNIGQQGLIGKVVAREAYL